jgi:hypothetical protein
MLSVFTPSHDPRFLNECYASLKAQSLTDWQWVVVLNGGADWTPPEGDERIILVDADEGVVGVGAAKNLACAMCKGEVLVELDHDDLLAPEALQLIAEAFDTNPELVLLYSQCAQVLEDGSRDNSEFNRVMGWEYQEARVDGKVVQYAKSFQPTPHNVCLIWFAPNHVRAFRAEAYRQSGGYDPSRQVLDDQDLMCRLYQLGGFALLDECLYLQRMHAGNTQRQADINPFIQTETLVLYDRYIEGCALAWARRSGLLCLDLGAAHAKQLGYLGVDQHEGPSVDIVAQLPEPLPIPDNSVGVIRAVDFLEHVADKIALWNELYRVLAPGGLLLSMTPSSDGRGAFQDPTHVAFYNENSFWYVTEAAYAAYVPEQHCRFQVSKVQTAFPTDWHQAHDIPYVTANLICLKDGGPRNGGPVNW